MSVMRPIIVMSSATKLQKCITGNMVIHVKNIKDGCEDKTFSALMLSDQG